MIIDDMGIGGYSVAHLAICQICSSSKDGAALPLPHQYGSLTLFAFFSWSAILRNPLDAGDEQSG
jgi:hypothetical protein